MSCIGTSKEQETCQVEKMSCEGCFYNNELKKLREENKKLKEKLELHKNVFNVEQATLELIRKGQGSYGELAKQIYNSELTESALNVIRVNVSRLKKKGYKIINVSGWGYKEENNG